jgi:hypothetical protein
VGVCTTISALQLVGLALSYLLAVLLLDTFWVTLASEPYRRGPAPMLKRQTLLNLFVALGAAGAAVLALIG